MKKQEVIRVLKEWMISVITFMYKWLTTDAEILGYILAVLHVLISGTIMICVGLAHTVYPIWQFKLACYVFMVLVWLQHIFLNVCIVTVAELTLTKLVPPSNIYLSYFYSKLLGTSLSEAMTRLVTGETIAVSCFTLELVSILANYVYSVYDIQL
jgi:hypothetical protein